MSRVQIVDIAVAVIVVLFVRRFMLRKYAANDSGIPQPGQTAPAFTLPSEAGQPVSLDSYRGKWVVLYFYPKDMTSGCTMEARNFQRDLAKYQAENAVILGVSLDTVKSHQRFCSKDSLHFTLLSDHDGMSVSKAYGVLKNYVGFKIDRRITFLIDPQGKIAKVWTHVHPLSHSGQVLEELARLKA